MPANSGGFLEHVLGPVCASIILGLGQSSDCGHSPYPSGEHIGVGSESARGGHIGAMKQVGGSGARVL